MKQPKLYQLLSSFSKEELRAFSLFLQSPYFTKSEILPSLFDILKKAHPDFNTAKLRKEKIYQKLNLATPFSEKFINDRFSDLSKLAEEFMAIHLVRNDKDLKKQAYRKSLNRHHLDTFFYKETKKAITTLKTKKLPGWRQSLNIFSLEHELFIHPQTNKWKTTTDETIKMIDHLDETYIILKLRYGLHHKTRGTIFAREENSTFLKEILAYAQNSNHSVIKLYTLLLDTFEERNLEEKWKIAHDFYLKKCSLLPAEDQYAGLLGLINRGYRIALNGQPAFHANNLDLYKFGLTKKVLLPNGCLSEQTFKNIVLLGSVTKQFDWTKRFIKKYQSYLCPGHHTNIVYLSQAYLAFYSKNFDLCLDWLDKSERMDLRDKLNFKSLELRCWYEQFATKNKDKEVLFAIINKYEQFLQRKKSNFSPNTTKAYQNFVYLVKRMAQLKNSAISNRQTEKKKIQKEFPKRKLCMSMEWLEEKLAEI